MSIVSYDTCLIWLTLEENDNIILLHSFHNSVALAVDNSELYHRIAKAFNSEASLRFVILLWGEKSSIGSQMLDGIPTYSYKEIIDMGHQHRAVMVDSHDARKSVYSSY